MTPAQAYEKLIHRYRAARLLESVGSLIGWDERTYMPLKGSAHRAEQMALLAKLVHEQVSAPALGELLDAVERSPLTAIAESDEAVNTREIRRVYNRAVKVPAALVEELARVVTRAQNVWQEARKRNDFPAFAP